MSAQGLPDQAGTEMAASGPLTVQLERLDRTIDEAERHVEAQEVRVAEAALVGRNTAQETFDLNKMQLLVAILREGRERLLDQPA